MDFAVAQARVLFWFFLLAARHFFYLKRCLRNDSDWLFEVQGHCLSLLL